MSWTYSGDPSASDSDAVRFLVGDTDTTDQQLQDGEITWLLTQSSGVYAAAVAGCYALAAKYARLADTQVDDVSVRASQRAAGYRALASTLQQQVATSSAMTIYAGGISRVDKHVQAEDTDRVEPSFTRHMHDIGPEDLPTQRYTVGGDQ